MNNYQLYRTNVALSGQLKWNISVDNGPTGLFVSDFHIVPISERVPFNRYVQDNLLNYSHLENIRSFYKQIESSFYLSYANPLLTSDQPYISDETRREYFMDLHDDTFDMGAKRARYSVYGKEVEIFCPVWLEDKTLKSLSFIFDVKNNNGKVLCSKTLKISSEKTNNDFHDRFANYLYQYINDIELDDHLIHIDLDNTTASITGIDASTGLTKTINIDKLAQDLTDKERLLMDADSMIIEQYENNQMIAKQLFNFNFLFNMGDFFPPVIMNMIEGNQVILDVRVQVDDEELEIKDFYTNYDYIPCICVHGASENDDVNIFDGLKDNKDIDLIDKNKITQRICHWSIVGDDEYIFNVYPEFGGFYTSKSSTGTEEVHKIGQLYQNTPNIWLEKYSENANTNGWANEYPITSIDQYFKLDISVSELKQRATSTNDQWIKHVKYTYQQDGPDGLFILLMPCSNNVWPTVENDIRSKYEASSKTDRTNHGRVKTANNGYWICDNAGRHVGQICFYARWFVIDNDYILCLFCNKNQRDTMDILSFGGLTKLIKTLNKPKLPWQTKNPHWVELMYNWMTSVVPPTMITLGKKLGFMFAQGPGGDELEHYGTLESTKIIRMGGYIRPSFVDIENNNVYTKIKCTEEEYNNSDFPKYHKTGYPPKYPSLGYYPWEGHNLQHTQPENTRDVAPVLNEEQLPYEHHWYTTSNLYMLEPELNFTLTLPDTESVEENILRYIQSLYRTDESQANYIYKLYNWESDWEYTNLQDIHTYNYTIKMKLK